MDRSRRLNTAGQSLVETALAAPLLLVLIMGTIQVGLLAYASAMARYAAFSGVRAAAVAPPLERAATASQAARAVVDGAAGLKFLLATFAELPVAGIPAAGGIGRGVVTVTIVVPSVAGRLLPVVVIERCAMPVEPSR